MKTRIFRIGALLAGVICLMLSSGGCAHTPWGIIQRNIEHSRDLRVGMTKEEVRKIMGDPITDEKFCQPDIWYYYNEMVWGDGLITEDECLPLIFENGRLIGWGNNFRIDYRLKRKNAQPVHNPETAKPKKKRSGKRK